MNHTKLVQEKLNDVQLRNNLDMAMHTLQTNRQNLIAKKYTSWEELRERAKEIKNSCLANLEQRLLDFEKHATENGMKVHWAKDGQEANEIVLQIVRENGISTVLKGKSMATEEIHLNAFLDEKGIKAVETDLGELIIQLIDEPPVHIVVPAIHKNRYEVGEIFHKYLGAAQESEPEKLNAIARKYLRDEFKKLKIGISGVNFAIADEGAIWLIENEGNGRMCTTFPDIHIAVCGIEKVVGSFDDAVVLDTLLVPSATGQSITCYNNIITGPRKDDEFDGPKEVHVILLDNNRTKMLQNKEYYEALRCIRCGACMNYCPVYDKVGGHTYQAVYPGPIGEVVSPQIFGMEKHSDILSLCSLCGRCSEVCPVKIPLADIIRKLRRDKVGEGENPAPGSAGLQHSGIERMSFAMFSFMATHFRLFHWGVNCAATFSRVIQKSAWMIPVLKLWCKHRKPPKISGHLHREMKKIEGVHYE
ncbi:MAG: iron-sulfur cluster-binding protein [Desulfobulbus propionicus]|nr:MAG: iron-sulfur cluster-binding protein [Desulfobulbus propionicus]